MDFKTKVGRWEALGSLKLEVGSLKLEVGILKSFVGIHLSSDLLVES